MRWNRGLDVVDSHCECDTTLFTFLGTFNATGQFSVSLPLGLDRNNIPISSQVVGASPMRQRWCAWRAIWRKRGHGALQCRRCMSGDRSSTGEMSCPSLPAV